MAVENEQQNITVSDIWITEKQKTAYKVKKTYWFLSGCLHTWLLT